MQIEPPRPSPPPPQSHGLIHLLVHSRSPRSPRSRSLSLSLSLFSLVPECVEIGGKVPEQ